MKLCLNPSGNTCGEYTVVVLLLRWTSYLYRKLYIIILWWTLQLLSLLFIRVSNIDTSFNQPITHLDELFENHEPLQEEPNKGSIKLFISAYSKYLTFSEFFWMNFIFLKNTILLREIFIQIFFSFLLLLHTQQQNTQFSI